MVRALNVFNLCLVGFALFVSAGAFAEKTPSRNLRVGVVLGLTGDASLQAEAMRKGIDLAAEDLRAQDWSVDLAYEDDNTVPAKTVSALRFLNSRGYKLFVGPTWSFQVKAAAPVLKSMEALAIAPAGSASINGGSYAEVFNLCSDRERQVPLVAQWLKQQPQCKLFVMTPAGDWGEIYKGIYLKAAKEAACEVLDQAEYDWGADVNTLKSLLMRAYARGARIVAMTGGPGETSSTVKIRNQARLDLTVLGTEEIEDARSLKLLSAEDVAKNVFAVRSSVGAEFQAHYQSRYAEPARLYSDRGYDALMLFARASEATDGSVSAIRNYLKQVDIKGMSGRLQFDDNGDMREGAYVVAIP